MTVDTEGRIYMATTLGIQVFDQLGKCHGILRMPGEGRVTAVTFSGPEFSHLLVVQGGIAYARKIKATGYPSWMKPSTPPAPRL
jgi:gluconolactonase